MRLSQHLTLRIGLGFALLAGLSACANLGTFGERAPMPTFYDLGQTPIAAAALAPASPSASPLALADVEAVGMTAGSEVVYRFGGEQSWQPRAYAQARWLQPPAELIRLRAQQRLAVTRPVVLASEVAAGPTLQLSLEDFSQKFDTTTSSEGVVRIRATLVRDGAVLAQRVFQVTEPARSADAAGGVQALARACDRLLDDLAHWTDSALAR